MCVLRLGEAAIVIIFVFGRQGKRAGWRETISVCGRARAHPRLCDPERLKVASKVHKTGYCLEAHIPAAAMTGFDPDENNRLGFTYLLRDKNLGRQVWTAEEILPVSYDPSLWGTAELVR